MILNTQSIKYVKGFTLVEVAVVMLIITFLIGSAIMPFRAQRESSNIQKAREELKTIEEALYGHAIDTGRLPCPTRPGRNGVEDPLGGGDCAAPNRSIGFVPSATLGLTGSVNCDGLLVDPWGNPYRYSVTRSDVGGTGTPDFTTTDDLNTIGSGGGLAPDLQICTTGACGTTLAVNAVAVVFSMGNNWTNVVSADETQNAGQGTIASGCGLPAYGISTNTQYVSRQRVEIAGSEYDDIVVWMSPNILYSKLLAAGRF